MRLLSRFVSILCLIFACHTFMSTFVNADTIEHINVGRIVVTDQSLRSQQSAGKQALAQVFVKLSGNPDVLQDPSISRAVDNYEQFLISSSFLQKQQALFFEATFNQQKLENLLVASGLSVWTNLRPSAVLWVASQNDVKANDVEMSINNQNGKLITQAQTLSLAKWVDQYAYSRGVDIVVPLGDLEDNIQISFFDVWNQFIAKIREASFRYETSYLISATIENFNEEKFRQERARLAQFKQAQVFDTESNETVNNENVDEALTDNVDDENSLDELNAVDNKNALAVIEIGDDVVNNMTTTSDEALEKTLEIVEIDIPDNTTHLVDYVITSKDPINNSNVQTGNLFASSKEQALQKLIDVYANMLAKEFALNSSLSGELSLINVSVRGVDSLADYVDLIALFTSVPGVVDAKLVSQQGSVATIELEQNISAQRLRSILSLDKRLSVTSNIEDGVIGFLWQGQ